ncbi:hypothetical protein MASR1M12_15530 [Erysipelotrichia bacterium]
MGLFIDDNEYPRIQTFPGKLTDQTTPYSCPGKSIDKLNFEKVIIVADGGLNTGPNIAHILNAATASILSKSTKKSDKAVKNGYSTNPTTNGTNPEHSR